uniref:Uncharacterized protein n=1 Tax=Clastoptera arizonana TaxID=38151 RepID=A0A1B6EBW0_9HEMI
MVEETDAKLILLGSSGVGKTCIMKKLIFDSFQDNSTKATIGALFTAKEFVSKFGNKVILKIWDTSGEEKYSAMTRIFYRNSKVAIVCYNICEYATWEKMKHWIRELRENEGVSSVRIYSSFF